MKCTIKHVTCFKGGLLSSKDLFETRNSQWATEPTLGVAYWPPLRPLRISPEPIGEKNAWDPSEIATFNNSRSPNRASHNNRVFWQAWIHPRVIFPRCNSLQAELHAPQQNASLSWWDAVVFGRASFYGSLVCGFSRKCEKTTHRFSDNYPLHPVNTQISQSVFLNFSIDIRDVCLPGFYFKCWWES